MHSAAAPASATEIAGRLEAALEAAVTRYDSDAPITAMIRYHFGYGAGGAARRGKRLRPRLVIAVAQEEGGSVDDALDAACAVEILHNYSLVHDDIEDGDGVRHGRETVWARWGVAHGINAGDAMCAISYLALLSGGTERRADRTLLMARALHEANLAMCAGQGRDIAFETAERVTMEEYTAMIGDKTAALFGASCELGALAGGADPIRARAYARLGAAYGLAFQIEDDVLGTWGESATTGKPSGADIARRKWTFPVVWALGGRAGEARDAIAVRYARGTAIAAQDVRAIVAALDALGARNAAVAAAAMHLADADEIAERCGIDRSGRVRTFLKNAVRRVA